MDATRKRSSFKPIERVAAIVTTCIVATVAYSAYRTYCVRAQVHEGLTIAVELMPMVERFFRHHGEVPTDMPRPPHIAAAIRASAAVEAITVVDGRIDVIFGGGADPSLAGHQVSLIPYETADMQIVWICGNDVPGPGLVPLGFLNGGRQASQTRTTIDARYLSPECR